jgi:hypothetical protein
MAKRDMPLLKITRNRLTKIEAWRAFAICAGARRREVPQRPADLKQLLEHGFR